MIRRIPSSFAAGALAAAAVFSTGCTSSKPTTAPRPAASPVATGGPAAPSTAASGAPAGAPGAGAPRPGGPLRPFGELTTGATSRPGFFDTYEKDGRVYLVIPRARLGQQFLLSYEISQGIGSRFLFGGAMANFASHLVSMTKKGDRIYLLEHPTKFTATPGSPMAKTVAITFGESVLESSAVVSSRPTDSAYVIDGTDLFVSDLSDIGSSMRAALQTRPGVPGRAILDKSRSYLESVKSFPGNINVRAKLTFQPGEETYINGVPDSRYVPITIHYTLSKLPEIAMTPRVADDRMGYFLTVKKDFSSTGESFFQRYVNKWRLECDDSKPKENGLCVPKREIVYYVDPNVPEEYRPWVIQGVNNWAKAYEVAGFKNAIHAELLPEGADAEDIRYPTIRWNASDEPDYGAIGPSIVDPRTGEILDADILFEASFIQGFRRNWKTVVTPATAINGLFGLREDGTPDTFDLPGRESALFGPSLAAQGTLLRALLVADGTIDANSAVPSEMVGQAITWSTMHEVGHTLGLRHNFKSSIDTPLEKLLDKSWTDEHGVFSSVMDYPQINIGPKGKEVSFYNRFVGSEDKWVISYGYTPDSARAASIARDAAKAGHAYGTDEDGNGPGALDPTVNIWDLGADPLAWAKGRAALISSLIPELPKRVLVDNARYSDVTDAFQTLIGQYGQAVGIGVKYLGGQYQYRDHVGDPGARAPFVPVTRAKQLEAMNFLATSGFGEKAFDVPKDVLAKLGADRWSHWGEQNTFNGRIDFPMHEQVLGAQRALLLRVTTPFVFARIRDAESKFGASEILTIPEMMSKLTDATWHEVMSGSARNIAAQRRDLQRIYIDRLGELAIADVPRLPADARSVARAQLITLKSRIDAVRGSGGLDAYTKAHLAESADRISKLLTAEIAGK
jgi:hypothetical protein